MTATLPLLMAVAFMPQATHVTDAAPPLQVTVFPAAVAADPAATVSEPMSADGYDSVHCKPAAP